MSLQQVFGGEDVCCSIQLNHVRASGQVSLPVGEVLAPVVVEVHYGDCSLRPHRVDELDCEGPPEPLEDREGIIKCRGSLFDQIGALLWRLLGSRGVLSDPLVSHSTQGLLNKLWSIEKVFSELRERARQTEFEERMIAPRDTGQVWSHAATLPFRNAAVPIKGLQLPYLLGDRPRLEGVDAVDQVVVVELSKALLYHLVIVLDRHHFALVTLQDSVLGKVDTRHLPLQGLLPEKHVHESCVRDVQVQRVPPADIVEGPQHALEPQFEITFDLGSADTAVVGRSGLAQERYDRHAVGLLKGERCSHSLSRSHCLNGHGYPPSTKFASDSRRRLVRAGSTSLAVLYAALKQYWTPSMTLVV